MLHILWTTVPGFRIPHLPAPFYEDTCSFPAASSTCAFLVTKFEKVRNMAVAPTSTASVTMGGDIHRNEEYRLLGHNAVWFAESQPKFRRNTLSLFSGCKNKARKIPAWKQVESKANGLLVVITQKTVVIMTTAVPASIPICKGILQALGNAQANLF
jgi:hypothetical protein